MDRNHHGSDDKAIGGITMTATGRGLSATGLEYRLEQMAQKLVESNEDRDVLMQAAAHISHASDEMANLRCDLLASKRSVATIQRRLDFAKFALTASE